MASETTELQDECDGCEEFPITAHHVTLRFNDGTTGKMALCDDCWAFAESNGRVLPAPPAPGGAAGREG